MEYVKPRRKLKYKDMDSLKDIVDLINEITEELKGENGISLENALAPKSGVAIGGVIGLGTSYIMLYGTGKVGLSGPAIMNSLSKLGGPISKMSKGKLSPSVSGIFTVGTLIPATAIATTNFAVKLLNNRQLKQEKEILYGEICKKEIEIEEISKEDNSSIKINGWKYLLKTYKHNLEDDLGM